MSLNVVWKYSLAAVALGGTLAFVGTGCSIAGASRASNAKSGGLVKSGFIDTAVGEVSVNYTIEGEDAVIGGDVRIPVSKIRETSATSEGGLGLFRAGNLWPNGRVPYTVSADFCCNAELKEAIQLWAAAGLKIVPKTASDKDYVNIVNEVPNMGICGASYGLGRVGGAQKLTALRDPKCGSTLATMAHELGHALGFLHEHQRPDRDSYLVFPPAEAANPQNKIYGEGQMLGKFDVNSVMMYSSSQIPGMLSRETGGTVPEVVRPSASDIQRAASVYGLTAGGAGAPPPPPTAVGGGAQPPPVGQPATGFSYVAPFNACSTAVGVSDSFPQLGISQDNIPYFSCMDPQFTLGRPIIVCRSPIDASSCFYTKRILVNGQITHEADILNHGGSSAGSSGPGPQPVNNIRSYVAPMNACRDVFGVQDSFPRLTYDSANQPVFVCKLGTNAPYPVMACYFDSASKSCVDTGFVSEF